MQKENSVYSNVPKYCIILSLLTFLRVRVLEWLQIGTIRIIFKKLLFYPTLNYKTSP
jgi:hypothetical protein